MPGLPVATRRLTSLILAIANRLATVASNDAGACSGIGNDYRNRMRWQMRKRWWPLSMASRGIPLAAVGAMEGVRCTAGHGCRQARRWRHREG
uniref:Putative secreted peptide n=1 Tax=Anopheles braziliensis TaxID=58242 RepID=A0A2M3ZVT3_9DIPT